MGSFLFKWEHPASEVYVTGTFDGWKKTEQLEKVGEHFEKHVQLSDASKKIYYKFVVDGNWVTDHTAPKETDESGNENNVLTPERIVPATASIMNSSAAPDSTTAALAAGVPLEKEKDVQTQGLPGVFPETPAADLNKEFSINPLPAAPGAVNPVQLAPGEKIPADLTAESTTSHVKLDPESYEKADTLPPGGIAAFSSAAPLSTTAQLAAGAPIETKTETVPEIVKESQEKAHVDPEASAVPEEVREKAATEKELLDRVKEAPSTSEGTAGVGTEKTENTVTAAEAAASVAAAATAIGGAALVGAVAAKDLAVEKGAAAASTAQASATQAATNLPDSVKAQLPESLQNTIGATDKETTIEETAPAVPAEVKESIAEAGKSPEAAASTSAVQDKTAMEKELLKEVEPVAAVGEESKKTETAPATAAVTAAEPKPEVTTAPETASTGVVAVEPPTVVKASPAAGATTSEVTDGLKTEPQDKPAAKAADDALANADKTATESKTETEPTSTAANGSSAPDATTTPATPVKSATDASKTEESPATTDKKKKNRISAFFGKLKEKAGKK